MNYGSGVCRVGVMFAQDFCESAAMSSQPQVYAARVLAAFEQAGLYTDEEIKAVGGPSSSTMTKIRKAAEGESGMTEPRGDTHRRVDTAAGWPRGSSRDLWRNQREPVPLAALADELPLRRAILESRDLDDDTRSALLDLLDSRQPPPESGQHRTA